MCEKRIQINKDLNNSSDFDWYCEVCFELILNYNFLPIPNNGIE